MAQSMEKWRRMGLLFFAESAHADPDFPAMKGNSIGNGGGGRTEDGDFSMPDQARKEGQRGNEGDSKQEISAERAENNDKGGEVDWSRLEDILAHESAAQKEQGREGDEPMVKMAMLLQYAYNAALRGCRSFILCRRPPPPSLPLPGPHPVSEVAVELIGFKYVNNSREIRSALAEITLSNDLPNLIIVLDNLSDFMASGSEQHAELAHCLGHLVDAAEFCHKSLLSEPQEEEAVPHRMGCELVVAEALSNRNVPRHLFVYQKFLPSFFVVSSASGDSGAGQTPPLLQLSHVNNTPCPCCRASPWLARFEYGAGLENIKFCCPHSS